MKKTITINLAGVVFHIEEDAFVVLKEYLESIKLYFQKIQGGDDILGDIESRIAEIFSQTISSAKQAITIEDVNLVIKQMGSVQDIMETVDPSDSTYEPKSEFGSASGPSTDSENHQRKLFRDSTHGLIGGVCAGLGAYFSINPIWIRLMAISLTFGFFFLPSLGGAIVLIYLILWVAMPVSHHRENKGQYKKFFRSGKNKVLGGVAAGLGAYFNVDPIIIRILFLLTTISAGVGLVAYVLLWTLTPEAKSVTDELQMQGDPVTLNNIGEQIRKNLNIKDDETKNAVVTALSFPFKILSMAITALGGVIKLLFDILRFGLGLILLFISGVFLFVIFVISLVGFGLVNQASYHLETGGLPWQMLTAEVSGWAWGFSILTALVPIVVVFLLSLSLMAKKRLLTSTVGMVLAGLFFVGLMGAAFTLVPIVHNFSNEEKTRLVQVYNLNPKLLQLQFNPNDQSLEGYQSVELQIHGWSDKQVKLIQNFEARGSSLKNARENASMINYKVAKQDSSIIFDSGISIDKTAPFRMQMLKMDLYIPYNQAFKIDHELGEMLKYTFYPDHYDRDQLDGNIWKFDREGLQCLTCTNDNSAENHKNDENQDEDF